MSQKLIFGILLFGGLLGVALLRTVAPAAEDKPPAKTPAPVTPTVPTKPKESPKPRPAENAPDTQPKELAPPMPPAAIQAALAQKVELNLTDVSLANVIAAIKSQTKLDIRVAADALADSTGKPTDAVPAGTFHLAAITRCAASI